MENKFIASIQRLMDAAVAQQGAVAQNLANQNTPGYRRVEVNFDEVLRGITGSNKVVMEQTSQNHRSTLGSREATQISPRQSSDPIPRGKINNVDMDAEMANLAKTQLYYDVLAKVMHQRFSHLKESITGKIR